MELEGERERSHHTERDKITGIQAHSALFTHRHFFIEFSILNNSESEGHFDMLPHKSVFEDEKLQRARL